MGKLSVFGGGIFRGAIITEAFEGWRSQSAEPSSNPRQPASGKRTTKTTDDDEVEPASRLRPKDAAQTADEFPLLENRRVSQHP